MYKNACESVSWSTLNSHFKRGKVKTKLNVLSLYHQQYTVTQKVAQIWGVLFFFYMEVNLLRFGILAAPSCGAESPTHANV